MSYILEFRRARPDDVAAVREVPTPESSLRCRHFNVGPGPSALWLVPDDAATVGTVSGARLPLDIDARPC